MSGKTGTEHLCETGPDGTSVRLVQRAPLCDFYAISYLLLLL